MSEEREVMSEDRAPRRGRPSKREESGRNERIPMGVRLSKLSVHDRLIPEGYVGRWINDVPGRLQRAEQGGYEYVIDPSAKVGDGSDNGNAGHGAKISRQVGRDDNGKPLYAFLMMIKKEWYQEDQETKQSAIRDVENSIKSGSHQQKADDRRYVPKEGIKIQ